MPPGADESDIPAAPSPGQQEDASGSRKKKKKSGEGVVELERRTSSRVRTQRKFEEIIETAPSKKEIKAAHDHEARRAKLHAIEDKAEAANALSAGKWTIKDDMLLKSSVEHLQDLSAVYENVVFSRYYSLENIITRWHTLLYQDDNIGVVKEVLRTRGQKVDENHPPFSVAEEDLLSSLVLSQLAGGCPPREVRRLPAATWAAADSVTIDFNAVLASHPNNFHPSRTAEALQSHFFRMKMVSDMVKVTAHPSGRPDSVYTVQKTVQPTLKHLPPEERANFGRNLRRTEKRYQRHVARMISETKAAAVKQSAWDPNALALIRGDHIHVWMKSKEITIGRSSEHVKADVDLTVEGHQALKSVSRKQAVVKLKRDGQFYIRNTGKHSIQLNGKTVAPSKIRHLKPYSILEFVGVRISFEPNRALWADVKRHCHELAVNRIIEAETTAEEARAAAEAAAAEAAAAASPTQSRKKGRPFGSLTKNRTPKPTVESSEEESEEKPTLKKGSGKKRKVEKEEESQPAASEPPKKKRKPNPLKKSTPAASPSVIKLEPTGDSDSEGPLVSSLANPNKKRKPSFERDDSPPPTKKRTPKKSPPAQKKVPAATAMDSSSVESGENLFELSQSLKR